MNRWKRLAYYLVINVFVSACTVWTVLSIWERTHPEFAGELPAFSSNETPDPSTILATLSADPTQPRSTAGNVPVAVNPTAAAGAVTIDNIFGTSDLETEKVRIRCTGAEQVNLTGWTLRDEDMNIYTFPQITIFATAQLDIFTAAGEDKPQSIYWGLLEPIWTHGETASLYDAAGNLVATFTVP